MMKLEELASAYAQAWNSGDVDAIMRLHAPDTVYRLGGEPAYEGWDAVRAKFASQLAGLKSLLFEPTFLVSGPDHVVFESDVHGATLEGRRFHLQAIDLITVRDGRVVRKHSYLVPAPAQQAVAQEVQP